MSDEEMTPGLRARFDQALDSMTAQLEAQTAEVKQLRAEAVTAEAELVTLRAEVAACWPIVAAASDYMATYAGHPLHAYRDERADQRRALAAALATIPARASGCPNCPPGYDCENGNYATVPATSEENAR
jgi:hypothetical protein